MKITSIKQQVKRAGRYSIFVDESYAFSLSETALLESGINKGQELSQTELEGFKRLSADDKLYAMSLRYVAMRPRTTWEVTFYLERKDASPALTEIILNKLSIIGLLDDEKFARSYIHDRQLLRPTSRRKMISELQKKRISSGVISKVLDEEAPVEQEALLYIIDRKRRQTKYQDDQKLMQYLARQGFGYDDIKTALLKSKAEPMQ